MSKAKLFVLSAPSGAGKTTLKDIALKKIVNLKYSISATTRPPREGEVEGEHYFFKDKKKFEQMIVNQELVEYMEVHGNYYGTPKSFIQDSLASGKNLILDLDVYGKVNFDKEYPNAIGIMILPPSLDIMEKRLHDRGTDSEQTIELRLKNARDEIQFSEEQGKYEYQIINDHLESAATELEKIIIKEISKS